MKIMWIVNTVFPAPSKVMGLPEPVVGGWMYGLAERVSKSTGVELAIVTVYKGTEVKKISTDEIDYYLLPCKNNIKYDSQLEEYWTQVYEQFTPDVVHIHGTEYAHGLASMRKFPNLIYIVSVQGLVSVCTKYYLGGLLFWDVITNITFRDIIRYDNLFQAKKNFEKRGILEIEYFKRTNHVIGRTQWDFTHTKSINPEVKYHFCNESLRDDFYEAAKWNINSKNDFTIFCSQATYPLKGIHQVLKAVAILKKDFPQIKLKISGTNITKRNTIIRKIKISGYGKYLNRLIKKLDIEDVVQFSGVLGQSQMINEYQKAHVFICSSSIENSPNSLGEAQLIGVPCISSYVGGVADMIDESKTGLMYRFEEFEMLSDNIRKIFSDDSLALYLSENGINEATKRHNQQTNLYQTISIYNAIRDNN
ncbi:glycosyltransferase family 4 protein [Flavobacterium sp.]|jgi:glycosyltransferase involved in cell wall biosynthesis|uniref:glycosyltransferase family 4 protein n=1 Tax=Flavobacterium sp. TaxID=239 RepID=UPI0037C05626